MKHNWVRSTLLTVFALMVLVALSGCGTPTPEPTSTPTGTPSPTPTGTPSPTPTSVTIPSVRFGIAWSSSFYMQHRADPPGSPEQRAADIGATWDRLDFQWRRVCRASRGGTFGRVALGGNPGLLL